MKSAGICEMSGHQVGLRQKAHIVAGLDSSHENILMLCPSCHVIFDTVLKPKLWVALNKAGVKELPVSWETSIYIQAGAASAEARRTRQDDRKRQARSKATRRTWNDPKIRARRVAAIRAARLRDE